MNLFKAWLLPFSRTMNNYLNADLFFPLSLTSGIIMLNRIIYLNNNFVGKGSNV